MYVCFWVLRCAVHDECCLLQNGLSVLMACGLSVLMASACGGHDSFARIVIEKGADVNAKDKVCVYFGACVWQHSSDIQCIRMQ